MDIELIQQIVDYIRELAEPMVTAGYALILKQLQYIMIRDIVISVLLLIVFIFDIIIVKRCLSKEDFDDAEGIIVSLGLIVGVPSIAIIIANLFSILNIAINPDWMAIKMITNLISGSGL